MTTFDERERGFENKFVHDEELLFRFYARRNKLLGRWAASLLGKDGDERDAYAREVVLADLAEVDHENDERDAYAREVVLADLAEVDHESDVYRKVAEDLGGLADERTIRLKMLELYELAKQEVMKEDGSVTSD